ncbi:MAG: N-6 DNA methylase [Chloroflexi bacterium]|nr:N-6 DNA methylase [Chloroflexota bacterium]
MTTNTEPAIPADDEGACLAALLDAHHAGRMENEIAIRIRDFIIAAGVAGPAEITLEEHPADQDSRRVDIYVRNTFIEVKRDVTGHNAIDPAHVAQLDGYLAAAAADGKGVQNGILTDGLRWLERNVGESHHAMTVSLRDARQFDRPEQAVRLRQFLDGIIDRNESNLSPSAANLAKYFGVGAPLFRASNHLLLQAYNENRENPTVADNDDSDWLFIRHTYITGLIATIIQQRLLTDVVRHAEERPDDLLKGRILAEQSDLHGIIDADLFTWPTEIGASAYLREIARQVARFNWDDRPREVAPTLYQNVITQEERKRLGEYYTPRWLAQAITETVVDDPLNQRVIDPSCGSGTFIETAVERILETAAGLSPTETLRLLQDNVVGIDIHPVAVQLAKATWVMAAADAIRAARAENPNVAATTAPIYLGDSMQLRYDTGTLAASQSIELNTGEILPGATEPVTFSIPKELARQQADADRLISEMAAAIDEGRDAGRIADDYPMSDDARASVQAMADAMAQLHANHRNHVWAYYVRNMIRPAVIAEEKVDRIIGNPPWLTYGQSADIIREELRSMSESRYQIWAGGRNSANQDVATLFYTRCAELYAKPGARIGMVLPHSALRSGQHLKWRSGDYKRKGGRNAPSIGVDFQAFAPWDLDNVVPDFFPMPASVVFGQYTGVGQGAALAPGTVQVWRGNWQDDYAGISRKNEALHHDDGTFKSPYEELSKRGADIIDRRLFFVDTIPHTAMLPAANTANVRVRQGSQDRIKYDSQLHLLDGVIHNDHLFDVYLGECVVPYVALTPLQAVLPVHRPTMTLPLLPDDGGLDVARLHPTMQRRWNNAAAMFREVHANQAIKDLCSNLNHLNKLTDQLEYLRGSISGDGTVRVAYTQSGQPTAAVIRDSNAIVDHVLFQTICESEPEAHYILAIINSNELAKQAKPFCPTNWAKEIRHFHKHGWKLPIPRYDATDPLHVRLSQLGATAEQECQALIAQSDIATRPPGDPQSRAARRLLRHTWQPTSKTAQAIEAAVAQLLSDPAQAALAARQMGVA